MQSKIHPICYDQLTIMTTLSTQAITELVDGELIGPGDLSITGVNILDDATATELTFIGNDKFGKRWPDCNAAAALVQSKIDVANVECRALIRVEDADLAMATVLEHFAPPPPDASMPPANPGSPVADPSAAIDPTAQLAAGVRIGANSFVGPNTTIGSGTVIYPNVTILDDCTIGTNCIVWPGVVIRERCIIGDNCILHPNVTIGSDGFGYRPDLEAGRLVKIPHIGIVRIGNDVEIGSGTCVDRAKFSETVIGDGCKIDNLCQIAHNCKIGKHVVIAGNTGVAGSVTIGDDVMIGGCTNIIDHATIGDGAKIAGGSGLMSDVPAGEFWMGTPARERKLAAREIAAIRKLPDILKQMRKK